MLKTRDSKRDERMPGWPINGVTVKRQVGMIYWYSATGGTGLPLRQGMPAIRL